MKRRAKRAALIGESPGPSTGRQVLPPRPPNGAGARLVRYAGISEATYESRFARRNLFGVHVAPESWSAAEARQSASRVRRWVRERRIGRVLLLGTRVAAAFGLDGAWQWIEEQDVVLAAIPHPSGRCRDYNDENARRLAGEIVRWAAGLPPKPVSAPPRSVKSGLHG